MKVLITGATGFIGSHLVEKLLTLGYSVSCLVRSSSGLKWLEGLNVRYVYGDFSVKDSLKDAVKDCDYVFHLAGLTKTNRAEEYYSINSTGTQNLIEAVAETSLDIKRFVYLSTLSAAGPVRNSKAPDEGEEPCPVSDYGKSKLRGEEAVLKLSDKVPVSIIRPSAVYGPRDREFFLIFKFIRNRFLPYWGNGHISMVYVDDLIKAMLLVAVNEKAVGEIFHISDGVSYSNNEIIDEISSALDVRAVKLKLPKSALAAVGFMGDGISMISGKKSMINRDKVKELKCSWACDIAKASGNLGFQPTIGIRKGIKWTADWYRIHKWL